jgi:hypothetical protein
MFIPGIFILGILPIWCFLAAFLLRAFLFFFGAVFDLGFDLLIPGILDMLCPECCE